MRPNRGWLGRLAGTLGASALIVSAVLALMGASGATSRTKATIFFRGDYESGNLEDWHGPQVMASDRAVVDTSPVRQGRYAAEFTVKPGDDVNGWPGERAQVYATPAQTNGFEGHEVWYAWSSMLAPGSVLSPNWNDLTAWHQTGPVCPAPLHFDLSPDWTLNLRSRGGALAPNCHPQYYRRFRLGTFRTGVWYDFVVRVKWSPDPRVGFVEAWINGSRVVPLTHTATLYTGQGVYLKQGFDRGPTKSGDTVVYNDGNVVASSYRAAITAFPPGGWPSKPDRGRRTVGRLPSAVGTVVAVAAKGTP